MDEENHPEQDEGEDDAAKGETDDRDHDDDDDDVDDDYNSHEDENEHENEDEDEDFLTLNFPLYAMVRQPMKWRSQWVKPNEYIACPQNK